MNVSFLNRRPPAGSPLGRLAVLSQETESRSRAGAARPAGVPGPNGDDPCAVLRCPRRVRVGREPRGTPVRGLPAARRAGHCEGTRFPVL